MTYPQLLPNAGSDSRVGVAFTREQLVYSVENDSLGS